MLQSVSVSLNSRFCLACPSEGVVSLLSGALAAKDFIAL